MVLPSTAQVVLVSFPFSDLSKSKLRPAIVLADAGKGDWVLCQITSNPYGDSRALPLLASDFVYGELKSLSFVRPAKLFTAAPNLMVGTLGALTPQSFGRVREAVKNVFES